MMTGTISTWDDTIVALSTPPGIGALGVIRLSGKDAIAIADRLMPRKKLADKPSHTAHVGWLQWEDTMIDEVVITLFRAPKSFTGEDVAEISCHGSPYILQQAMEACIAAGARMARPGEFTQRAFLNGKMDLTQAEAVADVIASTSAASQQAALQQMRGGFRRELQALREELIKFSALVELELDFATEDVEFADRTQFKQLLHQLEEVTHRLLDSFRLGNVIKHGVSVAIIGKPNAGKSTLLNTLLNENRAIVSDIAGTTRDTIEEVLNINGILFRLIDTAGIREHTADVIEQIGVEKSREKMKAADVVLYLFDAAQEDDEALRSLHQQLLAEGKPHLLVANKCDDPTAKSRLEGWGDLPLLKISAKHNEHIEDLRKALAALVLDEKINTENTIITNARHYAALQKVAQSLADIRLGMDNQVASDLLALDIRQCLHYLGEITGQITNEDQLDYIFSKFCIGK